MTSTACEVDASDEREVDRRRLADGDARRLRCGDAESRGADFDAVGPGIHLGEEEAPIGVGLDGADCAGIDLGCLDLRGGNDCAALDPRRCPPGRCWFRSAPEAAVLARSRSAKSTTVLPAILLVI